MGCGVRRRGQLAAVHLAELTAVATNDLLQEILNCATVSSLPLSVGCADGRMWPPPVSRTLTGGGSQPGSSGWTKVGDNCVGLCLGGSAEGIHVGAVSVGTLSSALVFAAIYLVAFMLFSYVVVATARLHAAISLLRPPEDPLQEGVCEGYRDVRGAPGAPCRSHRQALPAAARGAGG